MGYDLGISKIFTSNFTHMIQKGAHKACGSVYAIVGFSTVSRAGTLSDRIYAYGWEKSLTLLVVTYSNS